ncbi:MAG: DNA repair protein RecN [Flavobacteriales bacterium]|jgi:DNA repair protein RecN (Recombination protein N)
MLKSLTISNYALIDNSALQPESGFTAITGETGSGKSILLGAFGLLLGERADQKAIRDESKKCIVEAVFDLKEMALEHFFQDNDLDYEQRTTVRREIAPGGKSRAFINDTPVQLNVLKALGAQLVDIHSQHENSLLSERAFRFSVLDAFAANSPLLVRYRTAYDAWKTATADLEELMRSQGLWQQEMDYIQFQLQELRKAELHDLHQESLEQELNVLNNAEQIKGSLEIAYGLIEGDENSAFQLINRAKSQLSKLGSEHNALNEYITRLESSLVELRELARDMEGFSNRVEVDDRKAQLLSERLSALYSLQKKHRLNTVEELVQLEIELANKVERSNTSDERIEQLQKQCAELEKDLKALGEELHKTRMKGATRAEKEMAGYFTQLSMEHAGVSLRVEKGDVFHAMGMDEVSFLFKANKGSQFQPIHKVASGGELSRVMLAIKASISKHRRLPVLILDEIDQGVSGEVGQKIGRILKEMSSEMQLIVITHLPQIAGKSDHHWKVRKFADDTTTYTEVIALEGEDRINELAEMLSGKKLTAASLANARELLA